MKTKPLPHDHIFFSNKGGIFCTIPKNQGQGFVFKFKIMKCVHDPHGCINTQFELKFLL